MGRPSQTFDRRLFALKLSELSNQMQLRCVTYNRVAGNVGGSRLVRIVDAQLAILREWIEGIDRICREVWRVQGEEVTPEFVREILVPEATMLIGAREGTTKGAIERAQRTHLESPYPARHHLARQLSRLKGEVGRRYEIEAQELEYKKSPAARSGPERQLGDNITKASSPPTELRGGTYMGSRQKAIRLPSKPDDFPEDLWPRAVVILSKVIQKFPDQRRLGELCEHLTPEITPLYCEAVETGKMRPGTVLTDGSGIEELLRLLLIANDTSNSSWGLSNQAWEILQRVKTITWGKLAETIAKLQQNGSRPQRLKASVNQPESFRPHNSDKTLSENDAVVTEVGAKQQDWVSEAFGAKGQLHR